MINDRREFEITLEGNRGRGAPKNRGNTQYVADLDHEGLHVGT